MSLVNRSVAIELVMFRHSEVCFWEPSKRSNFFMWALFLRQSCQERSCWERNKFLQYTLTFFRRRSEYSDRNVGKTNLSFTHWNQRTQPISWLRHWRSPCFFCAVSLRRSNLRAASTWKDSIVYCVLRYILSFLLGFAVICHINDICYFIGVIDGNVSRIYQGRVFANF